MAWIQKRPKKKRVYRDTEKNKQIKKVYHSTQWIKLREAFFIENPLCQNCLEKGIIKPTEEIHHIIPISKGETLEEMKTIGYDWNNLRALCRDCHKEIHKELGSGFLGNNKKGLNP